MSSPAGITGVEADNDTRQLNRRLILSALRAYGKIYRLICEIDECVVVLDGMRWPWYIHGGGLVSGTLFKAPFDYFNLDASGRSAGEPHLNPAIKALVVNYAWRNAFVGLIRSYPTFAAGKQLAEGLPKALSKYGTIALDLQSAVNMACEEFNTDKIIVFDGNYGAINLSPSMAEFLLERAPRVNKKVDEELMPMWLSQRGLNI